MDEFILMEKGARKTIAVKWYFRKSEGATNAYAYGVEHDTHKALFIGQLENENRRGWRLKLCWLNKKYEYVFLDRQFFKKLTEEQYDALALDETIS